MIRSMQNYPNPSTQGYKVLLQLLHPKHEILLQPEGTVLLHLECALLLQPEYTVLSIDTLWAYSSGHWLPVLKSKYAISHYVGLGLSSPPLIHM